MEQQVQNIVTQSVQIIKLIMNRYLWEWHSRAKHPKQKHLRTV